MPFVELPKGEYKNLPINSFSSGDLLRIMANNLTRLERIHIMYVFLVVIPSLGIVTDLIEIISVVFKPTQTIMKILKLFRVWDAVVRRINPLTASLLLSILPLSVRKDAMELVMVIEDEFYLQD